MTNSQLPPIDVFNTEISAARATIYIQMRGRSPADGWSLAGQISGPRCVTSQMLSARYALRDLGPGPTALAQTTLLDPVGWSPSLPAFYDVRIEVRRHGQVVEEHTRPFALRWLDVRGNGLFRENRRFVLRGVERAALETFDTAALRAGEISVLNPDAADLEAAGNYGLLSLAKLELSPSPAVGIVLGEEGMATVGPNLLLARRANDPDSAPGWGDIILAEVDDPAAFGARWKHFSRPIIATRPTPPIPASAVREACDALRRDLAPYGQFAGYLLTH